MHGRMLLHNVQVLRSDVLPRVHGRPVVSHVARAEKSSAVEEKNAEPAETPGPEKAEKPVKAQKTEKPQKKTGGYDRDQKRLFIPSQQSLSYLDGSRAADFGFDPFGMLDPEGKGNAGKGEGFITPSWLTYGEVYNGRWAMLGAAGCILPEIFAYAGMVPQTPDEVTWFRAGVYPPAGTYTYWTDPYSLFFIELVLFNFVENARQQDYKNPGSMGKQYLLGLEKGLGGSGDPIYPGGLFNPLNLGDTETSMENYKISELRNGRLAMVALFGYCAQAVMTGEGPYKNLTDHLVDPFNYNLLTNFEKFGARHV